MDRTVVDYKGQRVRVRCADEEAPKVLYETLVEPFLYDLEYSWLSGSRAEEHTKNYLAYIAGLMIRRPNDHNVIAPRQMRRIHGMELTLGETDASSKPVQSAPVKTRKRANAETRTARFEAVRKIHPHGTINFCRVDTENHFHYKGNVFAIPIEEKAYAPKVTSLGTLYDMDRIVVVDDAGRLYFFDQEVRPIDRVSIVQKKQSAR